MKNYYEILGVSKDASQEDIKKTFRKLAIQHHPDKGGDENKFKEINEAYETLSDINRRREYDHNLNNPMAGMFGGGGPFGGGFDDLFAQMFGGFRNNNPKRKTVPDKILDIQLGVLESYTGIEREVSYLRRIDCGTCNGSGGERVGCMVCSGQGFVMQRAGTGMFQQVIRSVCNSCNGRGYIVSNKCYSCSGNGSKEVLERVKINFPKNLNSGQMLKLSQKGDMIEGAVGDLIIRVNITPQNNFDKNGNDLIYNIFFNLEDLSKTEFEVPHPDGKLLIKFPKEFNTQIPLRVKGKGFLDANVGDLFVKMNVKFNRD